MVGQGLAVLGSRCGSGGLFFIFFSSEILWSRPLQPNGSCQLLMEACSLSTGYPLSRSKPDQEQY